MSNIFNSTLLNNVSFPPFRNWAAPIFNVSQRVSTFTSLNGLRAQTQLVLTQPELSNYIYGIMYVPIALAVALIVYLILIVMFSCLRGKLCLKCGPQVVKEVFLILLLLTSTGAFLASLVFSVDMLMQSQETTAPIQVISDLFANISQNMQKLSYSSFQTQQVLQPGNCVFGRLPISGQVSSVLNSIETNSNEASDVSFQVSSVLRDGAVTVTNILWIASVVILSLSATMLFFLLASFVVIIYVFSKRRQDQAWNPPQARCCCTMPCVCSFLMIFLVVVFCAGAHVIALAIADSCNPDINWTLAQWTAEILSFPVPMTDPCSVVNSNSPTELQALCFAQTCSDRFNPFGNSTQNLAGALQTLLNLVPSMNMSGNCPEAVVVSSQFVLMTEALLWVVYSLSCAVINPPYVTMFYDSICNYRANASISLFECWIVGMTCLMLAQIHWMFVMDGLKKETHAELQEQNQAKLAEELPVAQEVALS